MRNFVCYFPFFLLFISCSEGHDPTVNDQKTSVKIEDEANKVQETINRIDTIYFTHGPHEIIFDGPKSYDSLLSINDKVYRLHVECDLDTNDRIDFTEIIDQKDKIISSKYIGYQGYYTFALFEGEEQLFELQLTKDDLKESVYSLAVESDAYLPELMEYNATFEAFIFECPIQLDGSCMATRALIVIGLDGKLQLVDYLSFPSSNSTNWNAQFTPNRDGIVSHSAIHFPNGKKTEFGNGKSNILGTDVFEDCLLVVYEHDSLNHSKNAYLKDYEGATLLNFRYEGWTGGLGYSFLHKKVFDSYYFIDGPNEQLIRIDKDKGKWMKTYLSFSEMTEFDGNIRENEERTDLSTETRSFIFFINKDTEEIRKITSTDY